MSYSFYFLFLSIAQGVVVLVAIGGFFAYRYYQKQATPGFTDMESAHVSSSQASHSLPMTSITTSFPAPPPSAGHVLPSGWTQHSDDAVCITV